MPEEPLANVRRFEGRRVLVVGDVMLDRYCWGSVGRVSPEAPIPIVRKERETINPGGAANVAANVASLGGIPVLIGVVGGDRAADELAQSLRTSGISPDALVVEGTRPTTVKTRVIAHGQHVARMDEESAGPIPPETAEQILSRIEAVMPSVGSVLLSDYAKGVLSPQLVPKIIELTQRHGLPVIVDPKGDDFGRYRHCTVLTPNQREAVVAARRLGGDSEDIEIIGRLLLQELNVSCLLITRGEHGMSLLQPDAATIHIAAHTQDVYDVTGAGDTVAATLSLSLAAGSSTVVAAQIATVAAGLAVERVGTVAIERDELFGALRETQEPSPQAETSPSSQALHRQVLRPKQNL